MAEIPLNECFGNISSNQCFPVWSGVPNQEIHKRLDWTMVFGLFAILGPVLVFGSLVQTGLKRSVAGLSLNLSDIKISALKSGPVPVLGSSGLGPWTRPVLIFPNMEGPRTGPHKTGFMRSWAVLGPVLVKTDLQPVQSKIFKKYETVKFLTFISTLK